MKGMAKVVLALFVLLYVVSPVDLCPGPIDDLIVIILVGVIVLIVKAVL